MTHGELAGFSLAELASATHGVWFGNPPQSAGEVVPLTDTRLSLQGGLFVALVGDRYDGHAFVRQALQQGAVAALVNRNWLAQQPDAAQLPCLAVEETREAYLALGAWHRQRQKARVVGLTGSSGKTTVKEGLRHVLGQLCSTQATEKNHNNEVGLAQTLLNLKPDTDVLVLEMAMRGPGEIGLLSRWARPDVGLLLNIGPAHIGRLGSLEAIAQAKCELVEGLDPAKGVLVANGDDLLLRQTVPTVWQGETRWFQLDLLQSVTPDAAGYYRFHYQGHAFRTLQPGRHALSNALAIITVAQMLGLPLDQIEQAFGVPMPHTAGRWEAKPLPQTPVTLINDAYNANPASMKASLSALLDTLGEHGQAVLVLAAMNELGDFSQAYHRELGHWLAGHAQHWQAIVLVGQQETAWVAEALQSVPVPVTQVAQAQQVLPVVQATLANPGLQAVFLKGSRSYGLDTVASALLQNVVPGPSPISVQATSKASCSV